MEAVTAIIRNLLKNNRVTLVLGAVLGLVLGLIFAWGVWPPKVYDTTPEVLRADLQKDYLRMTIDSLYRTGDANKALERWENLGQKGPATLAELQKDPGNLNPADIQSFSTFLQQNNKAITVTEPTVSPWRQVLIIAGVAIFLIVVLVAAFYLYRVFRKDTGPVTAVMQASEASRKAEKTNFEEMGLAPPITQTMTTYVLGDDLYDESFSIDTSGGEFLGEYGVGVSDTVGVGEPKKVSALEIWLFDKNDIKTATKVLMSEHAYNDPNTRARLEPKGELVVVKPGEQVLLETQTLQLLATVVDMDYGTGAMPQKSYFERITLELAIWPRAGK
ncbi:MAG: hypothetical protein QM730_28215 [Anaerolineales bacterium]